MTRARQSGLAAALALPAALALQGVLVNPTLVMTRHGSALLATRSLLLASKRHLTKRNGFKGNENGTCMGTGELVHHA